MDALTATLPGVLLGGGLPDVALVRDVLMRELLAMLVVLGTLLMLSQVELGRLAETWREGAEDSMESDIEHLLALGCAFAWSTYSVLSRRFGETPTFATSSWLRRSDATLP